MSDSIFTLDDENNAAINTVMMNGIVESNKKDIFTEDENGNAAVRVVGGAGSVGKNNIIIKSDTIPAASAEELGRFYCYSGETDTDFHHGYVYECVAGTPTYTDTVEFDPASLSGTIVTTTGNALADLCAEYITGDITSIVSGTMTYDQSGDLWVFVGKDENDSTVGSFQLYTQDFIDAGFTFTGTLQDGDVVAFTCTVTETSTYTWERIDVQPAPELGRYLSSWDCTTGLAGTNPPQSPYTYATGDYFIVSAVATGGGTNYKPDGSSYVIGQASTTVEGDPVAVNDTYFYDGTNWTLLKTGSAVSSVNGLTGDISIKSINGNSLLGSGDLELSTYLPYPNGWTTTQSTADFCNDIANDNTAIVGKAYLGEVTINDLPAGIANAEIVVEIMSGTTALDKVIVLTMTSGNQAPYMWKYTYWNNGGSTSGWIGFQPELPDQSSHAGEVITTDGANLSWKKLTDLGAVSQTTTQVTLFAGNWQAGTPIMQGVSVQGVTPTNTVFVAPDPANAIDYAAAGILCVAQGTDYLEFNCTTQPSNDIVVNLSIFD